MSYEVRVAEGALHILAQLPPEARERVWGRVQALASNPRPPGAAPLKGALRRLLRLRVGDYRVSYTIDDSARVVDVWRIGHRATFYKRLEGR